MDRTALDHLKRHLPLCPDIQSREQYFNSAVLVPLVFQDNEYHLLFQKRANHIRQGGEICFPGGRYDSELDENSEATAIRETIEELGITRHDISLIGRLDMSVAPQGVIVEPFIGILNIGHIEALTIDTNEVEEVFLVPVSYFETTEPEKYHVYVESQPSYLDEHGIEHALLPARELGLPERYYTPWGGRKRQVLLYRRNGRIIWGLTAGITYDFVRKLQR
ncbi:coenzyme A pyrophosphatase [candidate division KSB3 bacterium]|uniref:Coenzyme A pyrophosphatase n=1 Tax=candidate division KSB3 bacterium TaxID=2044937 RepID=A0A2G6K737_9BACT|nr:MAG: coenzyme A pyrophosphatase [candidate division KSB3 bacterium]